MITKTDCCVKTLEVLLQHVKTSEDLDFVESFIESYQDLFKLELIKYKHQVQEMRKLYTQ